MNLLTSLLFPAPYIEPPQAPVKDTFGGRPSVYGKVKPIILEAMLNGGKSHWTVEELSERTDLGYYTIGRAMRQLKCKNKVRCVHKGGGTVKSLWEVVK